MEFEVIQMQDDWTEAENLLQNLNGDDAAAAIAFFRQCYETKCKVTTKEPGDATVKIDSSIAGFVTHLLQGDIRHHSESAAANQNWKPSPSYNSFE